MLAEVENFFLPSQISMTYKQYTGNQGLSGPVSGRGDGLRKIPQRSVVSADTYPY